MTTICTCGHDFVPRHRDELCPACKGRRAIDRVEAGLAVLGADRAPRSCWDATVLARAGVAQRARRQATIAAAVCAVVVAALVAYAWWLTTRLAHEEPLRLELRIERGKAAP